MINRNISIHLQDFPDVNFINEDADLVTNMDLVRLICSTALSIRDQNNLRVRLPLSKLTIIGQDLAKLNDFKEIIADEVNVKNIEVKENLQDLADLQLKINFKKIGKKYGPKIKEITMAAKSGKFQKISDNEIEIAGINLVDDEFSLALTPKNDSEEGSITVALPDNSCLISLETNLTEDLLNEGIARDIVRAVQQARKDADLDVSDKIELSLNANEKIIQAAKSFEDYIKEQVLAGSLSFDANENATKVKIEDGDLEIFVIPIS